MFFEAVTRGFFISLLIGAFAVVVWGMFVAFSDVSQTDGFMIKSRYALLGIWILGLLIATGRQYDKLKSNSED